MSISVSKTSHFTGGSGTPISFSQIRDAYGGSSNNISASKYKRNVDDGVDWDSSSTLGSGRIPDCTENENITTSNNWRTNDLRNSISQYIVTQSGTDVELSYTDSNIVTWNGNLNRNILKKFVVEGTIYADSVSDDALSFSGDLYNLEIDVNSSGQIYGEGGNVGGNGGDALYVNNTYSERDVEIRSFGKIWSGGGGGSSGNSGNSGPSIECYSNTTWTQGFGSGNARNWDESGASTGGCKNASNRPGGVQNSSIKLYAVNPNNVRSRCRGGGYRSGQSWNSSNWSGYQCSTNWTGYCRGTIPFTLSGGAGGGAGTGGIGKGWSNRNVAINSSPHIGNEPNSPGTSKCGTTRTSSSGNTGNAGNGGGDWGQKSSGNAGAAVHKKGAVVNYYTENTLKGPIRNI